MKKTIPSYILFIFTYFFAVTQAATAQTAPPQTSQEQINKSLNHMLARAQLVRTMAAEHHAFILSNRDNALISMIEDATQVMAYNLICADDTMKVKALNNIATDVTFKIALLSEKSTISQRLENISRKITINARMELVGDMATTVLMYEIGRRRGLFDALLTDFGNKRFCSGLQADMRTRYNGLISEIGE